MAAGIDRYLVHTFEGLRSEVEDAHEGFLEFAQDPVVPMLVRVADVSAIKAMEDETPDCTVTSVIGPIVACSGTQRTLEALQQNPMVISIEGGRPSSGHDCAQSLPFVCANKVHNHAQHPEKGSHALIAVVDGGIDVLHEAFRDDNNHTRIVAVWDQRDPAGPPPQVQGRKLYGTVHTEADINAYIQGQKAVPPGLGRDPRRHGTHVASIAAGRAAGKFFGGVAPEAKILVVLSRLQTNPADPFSTGYSNSHVDALSYIAEEAERLKMPVVVNVSQGMNAGAHDGTSSLEAAFDGFSEGGRRPGRAIVKSAGNERGSDGHAKFTMGGNNAEMLTWTSQAKHAGPDVVELWFRACDDLRFRLVDPAGEPSRWIEADQSADYAFKSGYRCSIGFDKFHWDNGDSRVLVRVLRGQRKAIDEGKWQLDIESGAVRSDGLVHAWLERDDKRPIRLTNHTSEEFTLSIPGTARTVIAVGSVAAAIPTRVAAYSSYGPTRDARDKPDLVAPGEAIIAARSGTANDVMPMDGTSMATPHVSGAIALLFSARAKHIQKNPGAAQFNAAQIRAALRQSSQNFNGHATPALGYGILDIEKFLASFGL